MNLSKNFKKAIGIARIFWYSIGMIIMSIFFIAAVTINFSVAVVYDTVKFIINVFKKRDKNVESKNSQP